LETKEAVQSEIAKLKLASSNGDGYATFLLRFWHDPNLLAPSAKLRKDILEVSEELARHYCILAFEQLEKVGDMRSFRTLALYYQSGMPPVKQSMSKATEYWHKAFELGDYEWSGRELLAVYRDSKNSQDAAKAEEVIKRAAELIKARQASAQGQL